MNDLNLSPQTDGIPVKIDRVFDCCSDKDCLNDLGVTLAKGELPPEINIVRCRTASVENISVDVEAVPFNKGFYSIDLTFTFDLEILGYENSRSSPSTYIGTAYARKNCILYGSESSVKAFSSSAFTSEQKNASPAAPSLPTAIVSVLEPIVLETKIISPADSANTTGKRGISVTLGLFSVIELTRPVTLMVRTLDYSIPHKEYRSDADSPSEVFEKLKFPDEEFLPASITADSGTAEDSDIASS